jgi:hypothetical protein
VETYSEVSPEVQRVLRWRAAVGSSLGLHAPFPVFGEEGTATDDGMTAFGSLRSDDAATVANAEGNVGDEDMADAEDNTDSSSDASTVFVPPRKCKVIVPAAAQRLAKTKPLPKRKQVATSTQAGSATTMESGDAQSSVSERDSDSDDSEVYQPVPLAEEDDDRSEYQPPEDEDDDEDAEMEVEDSQKKGAKKNDDDAEMEVDRKKKGGKKNVQNLDNSMFGRMKRGLLKSR